MSIEALPFVSVQPDWDEVVREVASNTIPEGSFWIACYVAGKESVQGSVDVRRVDNYEATLEGNNGINVTMLNSRSFKVDCEALGVKDVTVFSPKNQFYPVKSKAVVCIDISPNGGLFAAGHGAEVSLGSVSSGETQMTLKGHLSDVTTVQFFPSNLVVLTGGSDFLLKIWSVLNGSNPVTLQGHTSAITSTAIISQGRNVLSSSRDGTVKLWNCGTSSTIATMGNYKFAINKMILTKLPAQYKPAEIETLDPMEVDTADKLVLIVLDDGSVRGIHVGTKKEIFATPISDSPLTAIAYEPETETIFTGNKNGVVQFFSIKNDLKKPLLQWKRGGYAVTSLVVKTNENGENTLCVASADGSVYQTGSLATVVATSSNVHVEAEFSGSELETVYDIKVMPSESEAGCQRMACAVRDGKIKIY
ncbi:WD40 repeat-like protein [Mucor ambiguus]|uniref:WD40 repeat-like protein n=1 Tax=Mucor ambiguus TaxID=91626 RepID=A0A0C9MPV6_9FUNG|nr:WD40 repeat-like protein [Mucor ambiguus]